MSSFTRKTYLGVFAAALLLVCTLVVLSRTPVAPAAAAPAQETDTFLPIVRKTDAPPVLVDYAELRNNAGQKVNGTITSIVDTGNGRLFVALQNGQIWIVQKTSDAYGTSLPNELLSLSSLSEFSSGGFEEGLIGLALHPQFLQNGYLYVTYTVTNTDIEVARFQMSTTNPNKADPASHAPLLRIVKPDFNPECKSRVHNAGDLHFGPDGFLYIAVGDGGPDPYEVPDIPADICRNAQSPTRLLGKILRIDVNNANGHPPDCGAPQTTPAPYSIPNNNPFRDGPGGTCDEIWSLGWRNPWRFSIDSLTGDMYIGDVGEGRLEEINFEPAQSGGRNYGWHCYEGTSKHKIECDGLALTFPFYEYPHNAGFSYSVIGGFVYRGAALPQLDGWYLFTDYGLRDIRAVPSGELTLAPITLVSATPGTPQWTTFGQDKDGEIYLGGYLNGTVYKLRPQP